MALTAAQQAEVDRAEALLDGLTDEEKQAVVLMSYRDPKGTLEQTVQIKRTKLEGIVLRKALATELATRVGTELEPPAPTVDRVVQSVVETYGKAAVQAALDGTS